VQVRMYTRSGSEERWGVPKAPDEEGCPTNSVAPTGFEPVFKVAATFRQLIRGL